jgi:hypothetical protein
MSAVGGGADVACQGLSGPFIAIRRHSSPTGRQLQRLSVTYEVMIPPVSKPYVWTAPSLQGVFSGSASLVGCSYVSGLSCSADEVSFEEIGEQTLRNIARPVHVWWWAPSASIRRSLLAFCRTERAKRAFKRAISEVLQPSGSVTSNQASM